jgi:Carboxypeptidase regulatory-like domain
MKYLTAFAPLLIVTPLVLAALPRVGPEGQDLPPVTIQQRDARAAEPGPTGTAVVLGSVTVADTGQPARKARVSLSGGELRSARNMTTDDMGRFAFAALPAGRYSLSASKPGHVTVLYGQRRPGPGRPGTPFQLADGQKLEVQLQIPRGGVITGTVLDEHGEAVPGTQVRVLRYSLLSGQRTLQQAGNGATDDRGVYRVYGLQPGEYIVAATPRNVGNPARIAAMRAEVEAMRARAEGLAAVDATAARAIAERVAVGLESIPDPDDGVAGYAAVYYPGTTAPSGAATVTVGIGEEKMGIDFSLQLVSIARVEGVVVTAGGEPAQNVQVSLMNLGENVPGIGESTARPDRDGRFRMSNVAPGQYLLVARATIGGQGRGGGRAGQLAAELAAARGRMGGGQGTEAVRLWAMTNVVIDGRDVTNLVLNLQAGMNVTGRLVFEGTSTVPTDLTRLRVTASPADPAGPSRQIAGTAAGRVDPSGRFTIPGVVPGRYRITAAGATQGWTLSSSMVSGQDTMDFPIEVKPNEPVSGVVLTFTDRTTEITGTIVNERGEPAPDYTIIVYPADRNFWTPGSRRISSQRPGTDGKFTFRNLPSGEYRVAPLLDPEPGTWYDPALLQQLDSTALRVPLAQGEQKVQNLRISGQ